MDWARILAYVAGTVDQELLARIEYLAAENAGAASTPHRDRESTMSGSARPDANGQFCHVRPKFAVMHRADLL
jgi:hypothetical protein